jgi:hypothetical protein
MEAALFPLGVVDPRSSGNSRRDAGSVSTLLLEFFNLITDYAERRLDLERDEDRLPPDMGGTLGVRLVLASQLP